MRSLPLIAVALAAPLSVALPGDPAEVVQSQAEAFFQAAAAKDAEAARALRSPAVRRSDEVLLDTFYEVLELAPFQVEYPEPALVHGDRALVPFQVRSSLDAGAEAPMTWLWMQASDEDGWGLLHLDADTRYGREWLYEQPKEGLAAGPMEAAKVLFQAMEAGDRRAAERASSNLAWAGSKDGLATLYQTTRDVGLRFVVDEPRVQGTRAVVPFRLDYGSQTGRETLLLVEQRGQGWIATGFDKASEEAQAFLDGHIAAIQYPASPFLCVERLIEAINEGKPVRARRLTSKAFQETAPGLERYLPLADWGGEVILPRSGLEIVGPRGVARVQIRQSARGKLANSLWLVESTPEGWRLVGETEVPDRAQAFLEGPVEPK